MLRQSVDATRMRYGGFDENNVFLPSMVLIA